MKRHRLIAAIMLALTVGMLAAAGQDIAPETSKVERKNRAPVSKEVLHVSLPKATERTLSNGLTVLVLEDHRLPFISLQYNISAAGPIFEPSDLPGLASVTAQMLREGTKTKTSLQIAEEIARLGAAISASSGYGSSVTVISASGLSDNFEQWFTPTNDLLLNPSFPADALNRLKRLKPITPARNRYLVIAGVALLVVVLDQLTKTWAEHALADRDIHLIWTLRLSLTYNPGIAFGLGRGATPLLVVFAVIVFVILLAFSRSVLNPVRGRVLAAEARMALLTRKLAVVS